MVAQRYGMALADAKEWFGNVRWNTEGRVDGDMLRRVARALQNQGSLPQEVDTSDPGRVGAV